MKKKASFVLKISGFIIFFVSIVHLNILLFGWIDDLFEQELILLQSKLEIQVQKLGNAFELALLSLPLFIKTVYIESQDLEEQLSPLITMWQQNNVEPDIFSNIYLASRPSLDNGVTIKLFEQGRFKKTLQHHKISTFIQDLPDEVSINDHATNNIYYLYTDNSMFLFFRIKERTDTYFFICEINIDVLKKDIIQVATQKHFPLEDGYEIRIRDTRTNSIVYCNSEVYDPSIFENPDMLWYFAETNIQKGTVNIGEIEFLWNIPTRIPLEKSIDLFKSLIRNRPFTPNETNMNKWQTRQSFTSLGYGTEYGGLFEIVVSHSRGSQIEAALNITEVIIFITICTILFLIIGIIIIYASLQKNRKFTQHQQEFIDTVTHELKTPISTISTLSQTMMKGSVKSSEKYAEYSARIRSESLRLKKTVEYFLLYSKLRHDAPHQMELCNLNDIVCDVYTQYSLQFEQQDFVTEIHVPEQEIYINANLYAIELVIRNLLENILKYATDGRYMSLKLYSSQQTNKKLAVIEVTDKGVGIPATEQKKVFEYFTRGQDALQNQIHGTGIGLYLVKGIVEFHGGTIALKSRFGKGSTFILSLPTAE